MKESVYLETTIPSYLTARPSPHLVTAAQQQLTRDWWETRSEDFDLYVSEFVVVEAKKGDPEAAAKRLQAIEGLPSLETKEESDAVTKKLIEVLSLPDKALTDAAHISICTVNGIEYLLTWNCTHIANAALRPKIEAVCRSFGFVPPVICTPRRTLVRLEMDEYPLLAEVRKAREEYALQFQGDVEAMMADIRRRQKSSDRPIVSREPRKIDRKPETLGGGEDGSLLGAKV